MLKTPRFVVLGSKTNGSFLSEIGFRKTGDFPRDLETDILGNAENPTFRSAWL